VKAVICEKPLIDKKGDLTTIRNALDTHCTKHLFVNYIRRYDPNIAATAELIHSGQLGTSAGFRGYFTKGFYYNGCHLIEMIERLFGPLKFLTAKKVEVRDGDLFGEFELFVDGCSGTLSNREQLRYSLLELDLFFQEGRVRIEQGGHRICVYRTSPSELYPGFRELTAPKDYPDKLRLIMWHLTDYVANVLSKKAKTLNWKRELDLAERLILARDGMMAGQTDIKFNTKGATGERSSDTRR
jgi:predicted dehydrogenase